MTKTRSGTKLEQGDVVLLHFPFSDLSGSKQRPALVLSQGSYNRSSGDFVVCAITSRLANASHSVYLDTSEMEEGRLLAPSRIKVDKIFSAAQSLAIKRLGRVKAAVVDHVKRELSAVI